MVDPSRQTFAVTTTVANTGPSSMPISFGWHPFFTLPSRPRSTWTLRTPACERHELSPLLIPTGRTVAQPIINAPIGDRTYDDHFSLGDDRTFVIADDHYAVTVEFDDHYPNAQIYLPGPDASLTGDFVCIEPMTAASNALGDDTAAVLEAGATFSAQFSMTITEL